MKFDPKDLVSQREAAEIRGVTLQAINFLVKRGKFATVEVSGKVFLLRKEVENYEPDVGGRPPTKRKPKSARKGKGQSNER